MRAAPGLVYGFVSKFTLFLSGAYSVSAYQAEPHTKARIAGALGIGAVDIYEIDGQPLPPGVAKAIDTLNAATDRASFNKRIHRYHAHLWVFGDAIGDACWQKGFQAGKRTMAPRENKILIELSRNELLHLAWLAHLGFKHMMPNYRGFEMHRFNGREDAQDGSFAVEKLEVAIPPQDRPFEGPLVQSNDRLKLIQNWWPSKQLQAACASVEQNHS